MPYFTPNHASALAQQDFAVRELLVGNCIAQSAFCMQSLISYLGAHVLLTILPASIMPKSLDLIADFATQMLKQLLANAVVI